MVQPVKDYLEPRFTKKVCQKLGTDWELECSVESKRAHVMLDKIDEDNTLELRAYYCSCSNAARRVEHYRFMKQRPNVMHHYYLFSAIEDGQKQATAKRMTESGTPVYKIYLTEFLDVTNEKNMKFYSERIPVGLELQNIPPPNTVKGNPSTSQHNKSEGSSSA